MGILYDRKNLFKSAPPLFQAMEPQCVRYEWFTTRRPADWQFIDFETACECVVMNRTISVSTTTTATT